MLSLHRLHSSAAPVADRERRFQPWPDLLAGGMIGLVTALMVLVTWGRWGDLAIDCGREMLVPAALLSGKRLYFDFWYPYGPLIPHWHAWLSGIFGVQIRVLYLSGLLAATVLITSTYAVARQFLPVSLAFAATLPVALQGFQPGIFNYVLPYSYPAVYGSACAMAVLWLCLRATLRRERRWLLAASVLAGIALSSKIEFGTACVCMIAGAILMRAWRQRSGRSLAFDLAAAAPGPLAAAAWYGVLLRQSSFGFLFEENMPVGSQAYFVKAYGRIWLEAVGFPTTFAKMTRCAIAVGALLVAGWGLGRWTRRARSPWLQAGLIILVVAEATVSLMEVRGGPGLKARVLARAVLQLVTFSPWLVWSALPLTVLALSELRRDRLSDTAAMQLLLAASALALALRISVLREPYLYGIYGDAPVGILWLVALLETARQFSGGAELPARARHMLAATACMAAAFSIAPLYAGLVEPTNAIYSDRGSLRAGVRDAATYSSVLRFLSESGVPSGKWVSLPETTTLYYFARALPPSRWYVLTPGVLPPGQPTADYLHDLERAGLRYVVLSNRLAPEYREEAFGEGRWNPEVMNWVRERFVQVREFGDWHQGWAARVYERAR